MLMERLMLRESDILLLIDFDALTFDRLKLRVTDLDLLKDRDNEREAD